MPPLSVMYNYVAFPLGIIQANAKSDILPWLCGKYINCVFDPNTVDKYDISLDDNWALADNILFEQRVTQLSMEMYEILNIDFITMMKKVLDNGYYIFGYWNEEFIPGKWSYGKRRFIHDYLAIGYNDTSKVFYSVGYIDKLFVIFEVPYDNAELALRTIKQKPEFLFYNYNPEAKFNVNFKRIISTLDDYLSSVNSLSHHTEGKYYGLKAIEMLGAHYSSINENNYFDYRYTRGLMEHKSIMLMRIKYLFDSGYITNSSYVSKAEKVHEFSNIVHNLGLKFLVTGNRKYIDKISQLIQDMVEIEKDYLPLVKNELELYVENKGQ